MRFLLIGLILVASCGETPTAPIITQIPNGSYSGTLTENGAIKDLHINLRRPRFLWIESPPRVEKPGSVFGLTLFFDNGGSVNVEVINGCLISHVINVCP